MRSPGIATLPPKFSQATPIARVDGPSLEQVSVAWAVVGVDVDGADVLAGGRSTESTSGAPTTSVSPLMATLKPK